MGFQSTELYKVFLVSTNSEQLRMMSFVEKREEAYQMLLEKTRSKMRVMEYDGVVEMHPEWIIYQAFRFLNKTLEGNGMNQAVSIQRAFDDLALQFARHYNRNKGNFSSVDGFMGNVTLKQIETFNEWRASDEAKEIKKAYSFLTNESQNYQRFLAYEKE